MVEDGQERQGDADLDEVLDESRRRSAEDQHLLGEANAAPEPGVLDHDPGCTVRHLQHETPDEVTAEQEGPIGRHGNAHEQPEDNDEDRHREKRVEECPNESEDRALVLDSQVPQGEVPQQRAGTAKPRTTGTGGG